MNNADFAKAGAITKKFARTFYFASHFLPQDKRNAAYSVYSICRLSDESVDTSSEKSREENLIRLKQKIEAAYADSALNDGLLEAFRLTVKNYGIPKKYFDELLKGMYMDLRKNRYENFDELYLYCYRVAGVVGLIMLKIFGYRDGSAENYAEKLGIAMQLTNILRDIKEDLEIDRIYLPRCELEQYGIPEKDLFARQANEKFINLLKFQIARARRYYKESLTGVKLITSPASRFVVLAMNEIYGGILNSIEKNNFDVFARRAYINNAQKIMIALKILSRGRYL